MVNVTGTGRLQAGSYLLSASEVLQKYKTQPFLEKRMYTIQAVSERDVEYPALSNYPARG